MVLPGLRGVLFDAGLADHLPPDVWALLGQLIRINRWILCFNLLPVYPLDGGQMLRDLLWFGVGARKSLAIAASIGLAGAVILGVGGYWMSQSFWPVFLAFFIGSQSWRALQEVQRFRPLPPEEPVV